MTQTSSGDWDKIGSGKRLLNRHNNFAKLFRGSLEGATLGVWIDWDNSGTFTEDEFLQFNVTEGQTTIPVTAPADYEPEALGVRFRLFAGDDLPGGQVDWTDYEGDAINGEMEDYVLFAATAVSLQDVSATVTTWTLPAIMMSLLVVTAGMATQRVARRDD